MSEFERRNINDEGFGERATGDVKIGGLETVGSNDGGVIFKMNGEEKNKKVLNIPLAVSLNEECLGSLPDKMSLADLKINRRKRKNPQVDPSISKWLLIFAGLTSVQKTQLNRLLQTAMAGGCEYVGDFREKEEEDMLSVRGFSNDCVKFIKTAFAPEPSLKTMKK